MNSLIVKDIDLTPVVSVDSENTENSNTPEFDFGIELLDQAVGVIHQHTVSSCSQISLVSVQCAAYVCAYMDQKGTSLYVYDLSPGATGKDSAFECSSELFLKPILDIQNKRKASYDIECQRADEKTPPKSFHCIHSSDATEQGILVGFETTLAQFVAIGEVGNKLRKKEDPLSNFLTRAYGKKSIIKPNYKKDLGSAGDLTIDEISLFFYGNSNFQMLGKTHFRHLLVGGLLNRCCLLYNTTSRAFEDRPESYDIPERTIDKFHADVKSFMKFLYENSHESKPVLITTDEYKQLDRYVFDQMDEYRGTEIEYLFKRVMQNVNAIIYTFHYMKCYEDNVWLDEIKGATVDLGVRYMKYLLKGYEVLIDELNGAKAEELDEGMIEKLHSVIFSLSEKLHTSKLKHREVYRAAHLTRERYDRLIARMHYKTDQKYLHVLK